MGKAPAFQTYAADYYIDTNHWSVDEVGIYQRLLLTEWVNGGLPNDEKRLARIAGCTFKKFKKSWTAVSTKFKNGNFWESKEGLSISIDRSLLESNKLYNPRLEIERYKQSKYKELQSEKGKLSAEKRWTGHITTVTDRLQPKDNSSSSSSSSTLKNKTYTSFFLSFWKEYPKKVGKPNAFREWNKIKPELEVVIPALKSQIEQKQRLLAENKFCAEWPDPERWIKNKRWEDEIDGTTGSNLDPLERIRRAKKIDEQRKRDSGSGDITSPAGKTPNSS
jgi:uncharacterized protein YdaU (DUF1376 family)